MAVNFRPPFTDALGNPVPGILLVTTVLPATPFTVNSSATHQLGVPFTKCQLVRAAVYATTVGADPDGVITAQLIKREAVGDSDDVVSTVFDFESGLTASEMAEFTLTGTVTDRTFLNADILEIDLVSVSAAFTDPDGVVVACEFMIQE